MRSRWTALLAVLVLVGLSPQRGDAQSGPPQTPPRQTVQGGLKQNYPNPFNPETTIPFTVGDFPTCSDRSRRYTVSITILNVLSQKYAVPVLEGGGVGGGRPLQKLQLECGEYKAFWDGYVLNTRQKAASGIYSVVLEIDDRRFGMKMSVKK
jgi:hypothetical protein